MRAIWHDLECGGYGEDLELWRSLAAQHGDPVLDIGAGTGRVALDLAKWGCGVVALDQDRELLEELGRRAEGVALETVLADARDFELGRRFPVCLVPMQTIQLLGGREGRIAFLRCAARHLAPGGRLAIALAEMLELYEAEEENVGVLPDILERDGVVYCSRPTAVRVVDEHFVLERRRERVSARGERSTSENVVVLDRLPADRLEREAASVGLRPAGRTMIPATRDYVGSTVVMLGG
jgi:SAM-dependent methyltransferase